MDRTPYPTDPTDAQWRRIAQLVPALKPVCRPARYTRREIVNAILYQTRNGCVWRALPHDLTPYRIAFPYFRAWPGDGTWDRLHDRRRADVRRAVGKRPRPSVATLDSQSVKTTEMGGPKEAGAGKKSRRPQAVSGG